MKRLLCLLGFHRPNKDYITEHGYWKFTICERCNKRLAADFHWIQGDGKWRDIKEYEELDKYHK